ncbi:MAG TPA: CrcB family protein [Gemmatales bacterium]|nr:CrcB family protein [Gemmatales bacterium]HMP60545.1 CrcB family protein [Gemmatales bacterium]
MEKLVQVGCVALGSTCGGLARWGLTLAMARWLGTQFPWGTFLVNVLGCLFIGWFFAVLPTRPPAAGFWAWADPERVRLLLAVGFAGSFTTFSTFEKETHSLISRGDLFGGSIYVLGSLFVGMVALQCGVALGQLGR